MDRKLAAILATDVVGYSKLMERDEQGTYQRLVSGRKELFEPEIARHHGRIFKLMGDGLLAEFASVVDAVECAVALQRGLTVRNASAPEAERILVRIGINLGEVIVDGDDRYGEGVNIATRLEQLAEPGTIYVSGKVAKEVQKKLAFGFQALGEQRVKNIAEPVQLFRVQIEGAPKGRAPAWLKIKRQRWILPAGLGLVAAAGIAVGIGLLGLPRGLRANAATSSIAVLPFENIGEDPVWTRLADGFTTDIIVDLSHTRDLKVIARNSVEAYNGKHPDPRRVGEDLGVDYVLEGTIQPSDDKVRISAQLVDSKDGNPVWSKQFNQPAEDIFAIQDEVTRQISNTLGQFNGVVASDRLKSIRRKPPANLSAWDNYMLGMYAKHQMTQASLGQAEVYFDRALSLDPNLARAYVGLSLVYGLKLSFGLGVPGDLLPKIYETAKNAVELDPNDGEAHLALGTAYAIQGKTEQSIAEFDKAESLAPNSADVLVLISWSIGPMGQPKRGVDLADRAVSLNPSYPNWYNQALEFAYFFGQRFEESVKYAKRVPNPFASDYAFLGMSLAYLGKGDEAALAAKALLAQDPKWIAEQYLSTIGGGTPAEAELFVEGARKLGVQACVRNSDLPGQSGMIRVKSCDEERARSASG